MSDGNLVQTMQRIMKLLDEIDEIKSDVKEIYAEAKADGFDKAAIGAAIREILARAEPEPVKVIRFAPKTRSRTEPAGVAAIRAVHLRMIRAGKIAQPGITLEMRS